MGTLEKMRALRQVSLFSGLSYDELAILSRISRVKTLSAGSTIFRQNEKGDSLYVVLQGRVRIFLEAPEEKEISRPGPHEYFGEMAILDEEPRSASASVVEDALLLVITKEDFRDRVLLYPEIAFGLLRLLSLRVRGRQAPGPPRQASGERQS